MNIFAVIGGAAGAAVMAASRDGTSTPSGVDTDVLTGIVLMLVMFSAIAAGAVLITMEGKNRKE